MTVATTGEGSDPLLFHLTPAVPAERMLANMRHALSLNLPTIIPCKAHDRVLSVAGGGPSLTDTCGDLNGEIVGAVNGSLGFLIEKEIRPSHMMCAVMDAGEHMADIVVADKRVRYYIASTCDPSLFKKLEGCDVRLWHVSPDSLVDPEGAREILNGHYPSAWHAIGGGCTMGLRWINLGYFLGFRRFALHGLDSSFRDFSHAYPDRADGKEWLEFNGYLTRPNFLAQLYDFWGTINRFSEPDLEPIEIRMHGDGLLQNEWEAREPEDPIPTFACVKVGDRYGADYVLKLRDGVARHYKKPHNFVCFTDDPVPGVRCYAPPLAAEGWWSKIGLFKNKRPMIYFDLDMVITGDLTPLVEWKGFGIMQDRLWPMYGSAVMVITGDEVKVYDKFVENPNDAMRSCPGGDQQFITRHIGDVATFPRSWFPSFKYDKCVNGFPEGALAVNFHGRPKPHECEGWVLDHWKKEADV